MWEPTTEVQIEAAINAGDLRENVHLDLKRELTRGDGARTELARDLASFAIDGGALLIGVAEDKASGTFSLSPFPLAGVAEQIENIAVNRVDPPLFVRIRDIPSAATPGTGYLHVEVPPSPFAPHMVDGRYPARGDRTKRRLTDAEVVRLHQGREGSDALINRILDQWAAREVVPAEHRENGHLYLVAEPLTQHNSAAYAHVARATNNTPAFELVARVEKNIPRDFRNFSPLLSSGQHWVRRSKGAALTTLRPGRPMLGDDQRESQLLDFEIRDNGGIHILMGRLAQIYEHGKDQRIVFDGAALGYAYRLIRLARIIGADMGYRGAWGFGLRGDGLVGAASHALFSTRRDRFFASDPDPYESDHYSAVTTAHLAEIEDASGTIVDRLVGPLLHGLSSYDILSVYMVPQDV